MDPDSTIGWAASMCFTSINHISKGINPWKFGKKYPYTPENHISLKVVFPYLIMLGSLHKLRLHFLAFDHVCTPLSLHFLCIKFSIFLTIYPPLNANVICEGSLIDMSPTLMSPFFVKKTCFWRKYHVFSTKNGLIKFGLRSIK